MMRPTYRSRTLTEVRAMLHRLAPPSPWWTSTNVQALLLGLAGEWERLMSRASTALMQFFGSTADETLADWVREYGLDTDACTPLPTSAADLRAYVAGRSTALAGQSVSYFVAVASAMGVAITIEEGPTAPYPAMRYGASRYGASRFGTARSPFVWRVIAPASTSADRRAALECVINRARPAHTHVEYVYA